MDDDEDGVLQLVVALIGRVCATPSKSYGREESAPASRLVMNIFTYCCFSPGCTQSVSRRSE